jgi:hypothetical protein
MELLLGNGLTTQRCKATGTDKKEEEEFLHFSVQYIYKVQ